MLRSIFVFLRNLALCIGVLLALGPAWPTFGDEDFQVASQVRTLQFDFVSWWVEAMQVKLSAEFSGIDQEIESDMQTEAVVQYINLLREVRTAQREVDAIYSDPAIENPDEETAELQENIEASREIIEEVKPLVEAIVQEQVTAVLVDEGFGFQGQILPPVSMHSSPLPSVLIVSPRDEIVREHSMVLKNGVETPVRAEIEAELYDDLNLSAYVTNIGGLAFYPTMIQETTSLQFFIDVVAHEWSHLWFDVRPLGFRYGFDDDVRTINESAASIFGEEIALIVLERHYPEFLPDVPEEAADSFVTPEPTPTPDPSVPPPFDFRAEMGETRVRVDELLADGKVDEAEAYMEERRQIFVANGYNLRVLNQAYFAFHGAYAQDGGGAAGANPIGPLVRDIYDASPSIRAFMDTIGQVGSYEDLIETADSLGLALPSDEPDGLEIPTGMMSCVAVGGVWEKRGASPYVCNLTTTDTGESCDSSDDCDGLCLASEGGNESEQSSDFVVGICSEQTTVWGCSDLVEDNEIVSDCTG